MSVMYYSFSPALSVILAMSLDEELVIAEADEEFGSYGEFDLEFLFFTGGVMRRFT